MNNTPNPVDIHVGQRLRNKRALFGMSQTGLAEELGLSFQQVQKYERGVNRISASKLFRISHIFDVPVEYFFEGAEEAQTPVKQTSRDYNSSVIDDATLMRRETLELVRNYYKIPDHNARHKIVDMIKAFAESCSR